MSVPIGAWLTVKELQFCEETSFGVLPNSPSFTPVGYEPRVKFNIDPGMVAIPKPGSEDVQTVQAGAVRENTWEVVYQPTDLTFAKYGANSQSLGPGSIDKSFTLLMSVMLNAATETWLILQGARPDTTIISGRAGGPLQIRMIGKAQTFPIPVQADPGYAYATSSTAQPIKLEDGGVNPFSVGLVHLDLFEISVEVRRNLSIIPQPGSNTPQTIQPQNRQITGTFSALWQSLSLMTSLQNLSTQNMLWEIQASLGTELDLTLSKLTKMNSLHFSNGDPAIMENYAFQATQASLG